MRKEIAKLEDKVKTLQKEIIELKSKDEHRQMLLQVFKEALTLCIDKLSLDVYETQLSITGYELGGLCQCYEVTKKQFDILKRAFTILEGDDENDE